MKISFIQPSRNNLKYLKWSYQAIRQNQGDHIVEICIADDASTDGTWEWCQQILEEGDTISNAFVMKGLKDWGILFYMID